MSPSRTHSLAACPSDPGPPALPAGASMLATALALGRAAVVVPVVPGQSVARFASPPGGDLPSCVPDCFSLADDGMTLIARRAGRLSSTADGRVTILPLTDLNGHVNHVTGDLDVAGDLLVRGNVSNRAQLRCTGNLWVVGNVEAAIVNVGGHACVGGAITGKGKGQLTAGASVVAERIVHATVRATGAVTVAVEIFASTIECGGRLTVERGAVFASDVIATGGVRCVALGAPGDGRTNIEVGVDHRLLEAVRKRMVLMGQQRQRAQELRKGLEPYMRLQRNLSPRAREQTTALLFQAEELETQYAAGLDWLREALARATATATAARIEVARGLHGSTAVRFARLACRTRGEHAGPVSIECRITDGAEQIQAMDALGTVLEAYDTYAVANETMDQLQNLLAGTPAPSAEPLVAA